MTGTLEPSRVLHCCYSLLRQSFGGLACYHWCYDLSDCGTWWFCSWVCYSDHWVWRWICFGACTVVRFLPVRYLAVLVTVRRGHAQYAVLPPSMWQLMFAMRASGGGASQQCYGSEAFFWCVRSRLGWRSSPQGRPSSTLQLSLVSAWCVVCVCVLVTVCTVLVIASDLCVYLWPSLLHLEWWCVMCMCCSLCALYWLLCMFTCGLLCIIFTACWMMTASLYLLLCDRPVWVMYFKGNIVKPYVRLTSCS